jgi:hypothetical protein
MEAEACPDGATKGNSGNGSKNRVRFHVLVIMTFFFLSVTDGMQDHGQGKVLVDCDYIMQQCQNVDGGSR